MVFHPPISTWATSASRWRSPSRSRRAALRPARRDLARCRGPWTPRRGCRSRSHRARQRVGLLRAGLGRWWFWTRSRTRPSAVAGLTALIHSLAVTEKGAASRPGRLLAILASRCPPAGHLPRALGRAHVGARVRDRPARGISPGVPPPRPRHRGALGRCSRARAAHRRRRPLRAGIARVAAAHQQRAAHGRGRSLLARSTRSRSTRWVSARSRSGALLRRVVLPLMAPALFPDGWARSRAGRRRGPGARRALKWR